MKNVWLTETMSSVENWFICYWDKTTSRTVCCCRFSTSTASKKLQKINQEMERPALARHTHTAYNNMQTRQLLFE